MPQHQSAAKRIRQDAKRRTQNGFQKARVRTMIKDLRQTTDRTEAEDKLNAVKAILDRLGRRRIIHPNRVSQAKSRLEKYVNSLRDR